MYYIIAYLLLSFFVGMVLVNKNDSLISLAELGLLFVFMLFSPISIIWLSIRKFKFYSKEIKWMEGNY